MPLTTAPTAIQQAGAGVAKLTIPHDRRARSSSSSTALPAKLHRRVGPPAYRQPLRPAGAAAQPGAFVAPASAVPAPAVRRGACLPSERSTQLQQVQARGRAARPPRPTVSNRTPAPVVQRPPTQAAHRRENQTEGVDNLKCQVRFSSSYGWRIPYPPVRWLHGYGRIGNPPLQDIQEKGCLAASPF